MGFCESRCVAIIQPLILFVTKHRARLLLRPPSFFFRGGTVVSVSFWISRNWKILESLRISEFGKSVVSPRGELCGKAFVYACKTCGHKSGGQESYNQTWNVSHCGFFVLSFGVSVFSTTRYQPDASLFVRVFQQEPQYTHACVSRICSAIVFCLSRCRNRSPLRQPSSLFRGGTVVSVSFPGIRNLGWISRFGFGCVFLVGVCGHGVMDLGEFEVGVGQKQDEATHSRPRTISWRNPTSTHWSSLLFWGFVFFQNSNSPVSSVQNRSSSARTHSSRCILQDIDSNFRISKM